MNPNEDDFISQRIAVLAAFINVFTHFYTAENKIGQAVQNILLPSF